MTFLENSKKRKILFAVAGNLIFVFLFLGSVYYLKQVSPNRDDTKLNELKAESPSIPVYPGFQRVGEDSTSRHMDASFSTNYRSSAAIDDVTAFYLSELKSTGWRYVEDSNHSYFQKNDVRLYIFSMPDQKDWNYSLSLVWQNPSNY